MTETILEFTDYDGRTRHVPASKILDVREPGHGVHDNGSMRLTTERGFGGPVEVSFHSPESCKRLIRDWRAWAERQV